MIQVSTMGNVLHPAPTSHGSLTLLQLALGHHVGSPHPTRAQAMTDTLSCKYTCCPVHTHPGIRDLEFTQDILRHVVLSHWVHNKVLVASRALCWPVLVAFLLWTKGPAPMIR